MKKLVIDRTRWLRGEGEEYSALLRSTDGKMCCLGFYLKSEGFEPNELEDIDGPPALPDLKGRVPSWLKGDGHGSSACLTLMTLNDDEFELEREKLITEIFKENGVEVEFK